ncbi:MAG: HpcH/HpaI aldolase/citrate lyase family protein [Acidobacteriota bacterium]
MDIKTRIHQKRCLFGAMISFQSPQVVELMGHSNLDFLIIDSEHASFGPESVQNLIRAAEGTPAAPFLRVPEIRSSFVQWGLDSGARGILFPQIRSAEDAERAVALCRYPPLGIRGLGPGRAARYGLRLKEYEEEANESIVVMIQIENLKAVEELEAIVEVPGIDLIFIGPGDLSEVLRVPGQLDHSRVLEVMERVVAVCLQHQVPVGTLVLDPESCRYWRERGIEFLLIGSDAFFLAGGCQAALETMAGRVS